MIMLETVYANTDIEIYVFFSPHKVQRICGCTHKAILTSIKQNNLRSFIAFLVQEVYPIATDKI